MSRILVVDDELSMREILRIMLEKDGHDVRDAADTAAALALCASQSFDLIISDIRLPQEGGLALLAAIKGKPSPPPVILITAYASPADAVSAMRHGAFDYITKPFKVEAVRIIVRAALALPQTQPSSVSRPPDDKGFAGIVGASAEMKKIYDIIRRVSPSKANVLIYGESGTGKELVAHAIHGLSPAAARPFVPICVSAIPESLLESELFGHVKGAFTGAIAGKPGLFEQAGGGSAFLDEIGELPPLIQTKLLRVLQEREVKRVGGTETLAVDVRIIAATNRDLEEEVLTGRFREDLFYRLSVVPIRLPPLRQRREDIPLLVEHFLAKHTQTSLGKPMPAISAYGLKVLMDYDFPGNVRELENIIERSVALAESTIILPESLTFSTLKRKKGARLMDSDALFSLASEEELFARGLEGAMSDMEEVCLRRALQQAQFSRIRCAELLKLSFRSLRYRLKKYGIS